MHVNAGMLLLSSFDLHQTSYEMGREHILCGVINANEINPGSDNWLAFRPRINWTSSQTKSNQDHWANLAITHTRDWWYLNQRLSYNLVSTRHPSHKGTLCDSPYVPHRRLVPIRHENPHHLPIAQWWNQPEQGEKINHLDPRSRHIKRRWLSIRPFNKARYGLAERNIKL